MVTDFFIFFCIKIYIGTQGEAGRTPPVVYSTDRSKAMVPVLLCGLFYEAICFMFCLVLFCSCVYQSF